MCVEHSFIAWGCVQAASSAAAAACVPPHALFCRTSLPGTGKTVLACATAAAVGARFFVINGPEVRHACL